jgi:hypothetical protein
MMTIVCGMCELKYIGSFITAYANEGRHIFFNIILFDQKHISTAKYQFYIKCQLEIYLSKKIFLFYKKNFLDYFTN